MQVEDYMLLLEYQTRGGGRPPQAARDNLRFQADAILLAHVKPAGSGRSGAAHQSTFTCNKLVNVSDVYGSSTPVAGANPPPPLAVMNGLSYEGAGTDIPSRALMFLVNRCVDIFFVISSSVLLLGTRIKREDRGVER